ncbi:MAG: calcium-binding protein [Hyphomicrobium sp.]
MPGAATTSAQFEQFLANNIRVQAPADSDVNFNVAVKVGTIESTLAGGEVTLLRSDLTTAVPVTVHPVNDAPVFTGTSMVNEDGILNAADQTIVGAVNFGANTGISATDSSDGSEAITQIVVSGLPIGAIVTFTPVGGSSITFAVAAGTTSITLNGGTEADIRAALATLSLIPPPHSDSDISLSISVTKVDATATEGEASVSQTYNGIHVITVAAIADVPVLSGSGSGLEDQNIAVSVTAGHPDISDGSEKLKNVVIGAPAAGLTISETSAGAGVLTLNGDGTYTVTGPNDAAINDVLANLVLVFAPGGARQHLDTDFNLTFTVTTIESAPSETGAGQMTLLETSKSFSVPVTVSAVADGVTTGGSSVLVEDIAKTIGPDITWSKIDTDGSEHVTTVVVSGFPAGTAVVYTDTLGILQTFVSTGIETVTLSGPKSAATETAIRAALDTLSVQAPLNSDVNITLSIAVTTTDNDSSAITQNFNHSINAQAVADAPAVTAGALVLDEDTTATLSINPNRSTDNDNSETLSVRITVPADGSGVIGTLSGTGTGGVTFTNLGGGVYSVTATGASAATREAALDTFLSGGITFTPRAQWSGVLAGTNGIKVEAISTEAANGYGTDLAPNNSASAGTGGDLDTKIETATAYIDIAVAPINDTPAVANASTIVQENNGSSSTADPDLIIPIGARLGLTIADTDGSQGLSMTLTGFPTNALALSFATSLAGVTTNVSIATGTVTINGASANDVLTVLNSLTLTLADDRDENFTISINGTSTDSNGSSTANDAFSLSHSVTVQAVADTPTIDVGTTTKSFVDEDSGFITYGVTTSLNDGDGSESYQSVVVNYSTAGTGIQPSIQFGTASGVTFDNSVAGQVTLTGPAADIEAALLSLQVKPGANNDADITITVTATAVESNPAEDNDGATAGMGGGIAGPEIAVPTAPAIQTFVIPVAALADTPTVSGSGAGFEDQNIPISITVLHPDTADGSEAIKNVVISGVPSGFTLSELSSGTGVLTANGGGTYTVTGPTDAAIQDVLTNLSLVITVGGPRKDLDTDFNLTATATTIESNPSEAGAGQGGGNEQSATATVAVTVTAVADGVTQGGSSTIVEDIAKTIGSDIVYTLKDTDGSEAVSQVAISGFTNGSTVVYTDMSGTVQTVNVTAAGLTLTFNGGTEAQIRAAVATINITPPLHSDANFNLSVSVTTTDNDSTSIVNTRNHSVTVQAVADAPTVSASNISLNEDTTIKLAIDPNRSADVDNTETMSVRITVPSDGSGVIGTLAANKTIAGVTFTAVGGGVYTATATGGSASLRETRLDSFLNDGVTFTPRGQWSGVLTGTNGIKVEAISTENATGGELAAGSFGGTDGTSKTETATVYINVTVAPVNDFPVLANASTIVQENNNSSNPLDPDLVIAIGTRLGLTIADTDGSQSLNLTLSGFPTNAQALSFGTTVAGVTSNINLATGTVTISGTASAVLTMINSLSITLADDRDENFTVTITGTLDDTNGTTSVSDPVSLTHSVTVQAVADTPTLNVGTSSKSAIDEDSGFIVYPVTVALNDTDGSETFQSILIEFSTAGSALGARPVVQFGTTTGVTSDASVAGQVTLTGTAADLAAAMATLQVKPGADNGEDITIRVTATSVESNPTEDNNGAVAGMGGGVAGAEISVPTAAIAQTFVIPVNPVPEIPVITVPGPASGSEDTTFAIGTITISTGSADPDGSETRFIEIDTSTFPSGTQFWSSGSTIGVAVSGWIRIPESALANLEIRAPLNYSGTMTLSVRGVVVDTNSTGSVTATTTPQTISVTVTPDADAISTPALSVGVEDNGAVAFGADLANATTGIRVTDNGTGGGNNADTETMSQIVLDFPADTATQTYTVVPGAAVGSAQIAFDSGTNTYTITSTIITGAANAGLLTQADRNLAEADIRATLNGFTVTMGPTHTDLNGAVAVTATTLDVNGGIANTQDNTFNHDIRIQAVADTPSVTVTDPASATPEDGSNILLTINAGNSADLDNSETVSVRITVPADSLGAVGTITGTPPANVTLTSLGGGIYLVQATGADNATRAASLNSFINGGGLAFDPRANWSGSLTGTNGIKIEVISTEAATGVELAATIFGGTDGTSKTETVTDYIDILISPAVDTPTVKGNGTGLEDTIISVPMSVTLNDKDGSETFIVKITSVVPAGTFIYGAGGALLVPDGFGVYTLTPADVAALAVKAPLHYSTATGGDVHLTTETIVTDTSGGGTSVSSFITTIDVQVTGVADQPGTRTVNVVADEDDLIQIGSHILSSAGGDLNNLLVDTDGSESLSFVIGGLPAGIIPVSSVAGVAYLGNGTWSVSAAAMPTLTLPPVQNFSGENPYSGVTVRAVTQEIDGSQATSPQWPVSIVVNPVIAGGTVDGFSSWGLGATQSEAASESGTNISLASSLNYTLADNDGSETVIEYTFNLTNLITNAGIATQLSSLPGAGSGIDKLVANYITGTFVYDSGAKTITVQASLIGGVALSSQLFLDSNRDFSIPVTALVRDTAIIGGSPVTVDKLESGSFGVNFTGTADVPTVFANSVSGNSGTSIPLTLGGTTTDTDVTLGRLQSEDIFYVLRTTNTGTAPLFGLTDSFGNVVGIDTGNGSFLINPSDLADLRIITPPGAGGTINFELTTVATENDGDRATNSTNFTVTVVPLAGTGPGDAPLPPAVTVGANNGNEDGPITLNVSAVPAAGDLTNPSVSVVISGIPAGAQVTGAILLPPVNVGDAPRWVATAAAVNGGAVHVTPPPDFSGTMNITVEGIARNVNLQSATTGPRIVPILVDPVADGVAIGASPAAGSEDLPIALGLSLGEVDTDGSEDIGVFCYVKLTNGATVIGGYPAVAAGDSDATIDGTSLVGYYRVPTSSAASLQIQPALNWHGSIGVTVAAYSVEPVDSTPDADNTKLSTSNFTVSVTAVADAPAVSAPATVSGSEDTAIALTDGVTLLSAALADTVADNGAEVLSVKISGVPDGSRFSSGSNNGDGSWTIPVSALATLSLTPPLNYSGTMTLTLTAITLELSNGNEAQTSVNFNAVVSPAADSVEILARDLTIDVAGQVALDLNVRLSDTTGSSPGENAEEQIRITFTSVPVGVALTAASGGAMTNPSAGTFQFTGTQTQANSILAIAGAGATGGNHVISISAVTLDGASTLASPVTDSFILTLPDILTGTASDDTLTSATGTQLLFGLAGADTLNGGLGADRMTGGDGNDTYTADNAGDVIVENAGEGSADLVQTTLATYSLGANLENLTFTGAGNFTGTGTSAANIITGGTGNDTLDGSIGADTLNGGGGDDTYVIDNAADSITDTSGIDTVQTSLATYTLAANLENLIFTGAGNFTGNGNGAGNVITGGTGNDTLDGGIGADTLDGGGGSDILRGGTGIDILSGGAGIDTYRWQAGDNSGGSDQITDFVNGVGGDTLDISALLVGFTGSSVLSDFVRKTEGAGNTTISIDTDGAAGGANFVDLVVLQGQTGIDLNQMKTNGNLIV